MADDIWHRRVVASPCGIISMTICFDIDPHAMISAYYVKGNSAPDMAFAILTLAHALPARPNGVLIERRAAGAHMFQYRSLTHAEIALKWLAIRQA